MNDIGTDPKSSEGPHRRPTIDPSRLWGRLMAMADIGATGDGGVSRPALDEADIDAHRYLADIGLELGLDLHLDEAGNMFLRLAGLDESLAPVVSGSHCDTVPCGGRFDGTLGVLAALEAIEAIAKSGLRHRRSIECVVWNNEEGSRFAPGCMGSAAYTKRLQLDSMLSTVDDEGDTMERAVRALRSRLPEARERPLFTAFEAFLELHIEQGPILEESGTMIGVVTGVQGYRRILVQVKGRPDHSGTTPRSRRQDAFLAAMRICNALQDQLPDEHDVLRLTIGRFSIEPNSWSVVPGLATFGIDIRHPDESALAAAELLIRQLVTSNSGDCISRVRQMAAVEPVHFGAKIPDLVESLAVRANLSSLRLFSGAGHDCRNLVPHCPSGMIFIPCRGGVSHSPLEYAAKDHVAAGAQLLTDCLWNLSEAI